MWNFDYITKKTYVCREITPCPSDINMVSQARECNENSGTIEFSLNVFTEFSEFSDKNNIILKSLIHATLILSDSLNSLKPVSSINVLLHLGETPMCVSMTFWSHATLFYSHNVWVESVVNLDAPVNSMNFNFTFQRILLVSSKFRFKLNTRSRVLDNPVISLSVSSEVIISLEHNKRKHFLFGVFLIVFTQWSTTFSHRTVDSKSPHFVLERLFSRRGIVRLWVTFVSSLVKVVKGLVLRFRHLNCFHSTLWRKQ